jgi:fructose-1,6-bisphosphatase class II
VERNLALELVRVTEAAALAAARENGRGDEMAPERVASAAICRAFPGIDAHGEIVVGDPQQGEGDGLATGAYLGDHGEEVDIAVDPLEGGISCALGGPNAMSIMALGDKGAILRCPPHTYMEKIAAGGEGRGVVSLDKTPAENLRALAERRSCYVEDLTVIILDRPRHDDLIEQVRSAGARVRLIPHGDVAAAMAAARPESGVDLLMGTGGASQGILSAAAIKCMGGFIQCRFAPRDQRETNALYESGVKDVSRVLELEDMVRGHILFAATGVTNGEYLQGVRFFKGGAVSHSVVMRSASLTLRLLESYHRFDYKPRYD